MSSQVLARKWRPRSFATLVGQDHVVRALTHALDTNRLHHAYLFTGTRGVGKTTIARIVAKALNCETGITSNPCGVCSACTEVDQGRYPDYIEMDAASNRGVSEMAQILDAAVYAPSAGRFKVYVIDEVHMLTTAAFNAMLKTLEEPPGHVVFILATTDPQKVPATVLSRCLQFGLKNMPAPAIVDHAQRILEQEGIASDSAALSLIAKAANGSMRDALSLLDQAIAYGGGELKKESVSQMLGAINSSDLYELLDAVLQSDGALVLAKAQAMQNNGTPLDHVLSDLSTLLHRVAITQVAGRSQDSEFDPEQLERLSHLVSPSVLQALYQICIYGQRDLSLAPDPLSGFTMTLVRMIAFLPRVSTEPRVSALKVPSPAIRTAVPVNAAAVPNVRNGVAQPSALPKPKAPEVLKDSSASQSVVTPPPTSPTPLSAAVEPPLANPVVKNLLGFDGNWPKLAAAIPLSGMARQLATQSELLRYEGDLLELRVGLKSLAETQNLNKLKDALAEHFGKPIRLSVTVGAVQGQTAAQVAAQAQELKQQNAESAVHADPVIQTIIREFGATIVPGSIRSVN
jgi:DNA polymerase III subunit gamma/tau